MTPTPHWPRHFFLVAPGQGRPHATATREHMGSKAHNLMRMALLGLPVPPALVIGTHHAQHPDDCLLPFFSIGLPELEKTAGQLMGDPRNPLIVSVRSGAPISMPGMMDTLLNIGLCDATLPGLLRQTGNPRMVWDAYRRLVASHGEIVAGLDPALFEAELARLCAGRDERALDFSELRDLTRRFLAIYDTHAGRPFPQDVNTQLASAIQAVFQSWHAPKAQAYRRLHHIDDAMGTAVTLQRMVFGNTGGHSGAGVGFSRDPSSGEPQLWLDFLVNAQGEDVVSGRRNAHGHEALAEIAPQAWADLTQAAQRLEREFQDMQDFEFTVQDGALYLLQARSGKRTPLAAARIALDLLAEGLIDAATALERTQALTEADLGVMQLAPTDAQSPIDHAPLASAMPACSGVVCGAIALDGASAQQLVAQGQTAVLLRQDADTADITALQTAAGLLTQRGARTSHAAVVARQLGKVCLVGCNAMAIDLPQRRVRIGEHTLNEGDTITLDGNTGHIHAGTLASQWVVDQDLLDRLQALRQAHPTRPTTKAHA